MSVPTSRRYISGQIKIDTLLAFTFGVIFVTAILVFAVIIVNPSPLQILTFQTVLALAGAGVAAVIPGQFEFRHLPFIRAGGAIAVFALIFATPLKVVSSVAQFVVPKVDAQPVMNAYLAAVDKGDYESSWKQIDPDAPKWYQIDHDQWLELYINAAAPLGTAVSRIVTFRGGAESPAGLPPGIYRHVVYNTRFAKIDSCRQEMIVVRATNTLEWRVFSHQVAPSGIPCLDKPSEPSTSL